MSEKTFFVLFIKNHGTDHHGNHQGLEAFIIEDGKMTFKKQEKLLNNGFKLIHDSLLSHEAAESYANEHYDAHVNSCCLCNNYTRTHLIKGRRWNNANGRYLVFNGWVCNQCADALEVTGKIVKSDNYVNTDYIQFPNSFTDMAIADFPELVNND
ncbi:MAG: hypothetical protein AB7G87_09125 [Clostridia bacterium]